MLSVVFSLGHSIPTLHPSPTPSPPPPHTGGGLGGTRKGAPHENIKYSGRVDER